MAYKVATAPVLEPFTRAEIKTWLKIQSSVTVEDTLLDNLIVAARDWAEKQTNTALITQTIEEYFDCFPCGSVMNLTLSPVQSVTSVSYYSGGTYVSWDSANYYTDLVSKPARVVIKNSSVFPTTDLGAPNAVKVVYVAGYTAASAIPMTLKQAMLQKIAYMYENREDVPGGQSNRIRSADALAAFNRQYV